MGSGNATCSSGAIKPSWCMAARAIDSPPFALPGIQERRGIPCRGNSPEPLLALDIVSKLVPCHFPNAEGRVSDGGAVLKAQGAHAVEGRSLEGRHGNAVHHGRGKAGRDAVALDGRAASRVRIRWRGHMDETLHAMGDRKAQGDGRRAAHRPSRRSGGLVPKRTGSPCVSNRQASSR